MQSSEKDTPRNTAAIVVTNDNQRRNWAAAFDCTEDRLRSAVAAVGSEPAAVYRWLKNLLA